MTEVKQNALSSSQNSKNNNDNKQSSGADTGTDEMCGESAPPNTHTHTHTPVSCHSTFFRLFRFFIHICVSFKCYSAFTRFDVTLPKRQSTPLAMTRNEDGLLLLLLLPYTPSCKHFVFLFPFLFLTVPLTQRDDYYLVLLK